MGRRREGVAIAAAAAEEEEEEVGDEIIGSVRSLIGLERRFAAQMHCCLLTAVLAAGLLVSSGEGSGKPLAINAPLATARWGHRLARGCSTILAFQNQIFCGVVGSWLVARG
jgi:hypothetical protein